MSENKEYPIADNPLSRNLAYLFRHKSSGHPVPHSNAGFIAELDKIQEEILRTDPAGTKCSRQAMINVIIGNKNPSLRAIKKLCAAYESLYMIKIDPYDLFTDRGKWLNTSRFSSTQQEICRNVKYISKQSILDGILAFSQSEIQDLDKANLDRRKYSDDSFYFPKDGN